MKTSLLNIIKPIILLMILAFTAIACDKDFVNVESDIRGAQNFTTNSKLFPFVAYNKKLDPVQTNSLPNNFLGIYNDPNYGTTSASIVTQITPANLAPDFGTDTEIISVKLYIPYFSTVTGIDEDGNTTYTLDSVYGDTSNTYKLSVLKNNYYLRDLDPASDFNEVQAYYSDAYTTLNLSAFEGELLYEDENFTPSELHVPIEEIPIGSSDPMDTEELESSRAPGLYIDLTQEELGLENWKNLLLLGDGTVNPEITNISDFKDFFRGIIFKVEAETPENINSNMLLLDINNGAKIDIRFEKDTDETDVRDRETYTFNFDGIKFNTIENFSNFITLNDGDQNDGDDQLFIKGLQGSMTVLDLFNGSIIDENNNTQDAFTYFKDREDKWLINEANLNFYVDHSNSSGGQAEPDRIVVFDLNNKIPIVDFFIDPTINSSDPVNSGIVYSPKLERDVNDIGIKYKIRLTEHINRILINDSTNVKLGLYVSSNVNLTGTSKILDALEDDVVNIIPQTSVIAPEGTILHGNTPAVQENVRATFEIFYTEPEN